MFVFPISTDAPLYYWPWMTVVLIVSNVISFVATGFGIPDNEALWSAWVLEYGQGLHPLEWISCNFLHFGPMHLIGNMFFLWVFGLIVEGKIGWWRFVLVYLGIGIVHAFIEQSIMLGSNPGPTDPQGSGGASGAIFGLMAIALVWAPKNDVTFVGFIWVHPTSFDVSVLVLSVFYLAMQVIFASLSNFAMSSEIIHLLGAAVGLAVGVVMLKSRWVDCENWDLFNVLAGTNIRSTYEYSYAAAEEARATARRGGPVSERKKRQKKRARPDAIRRSRAARYQQQVEESLQRMANLLDRGKPLAALQEYQAAKDFDPDHQVEPDDLRLLAQGLCREKAWKQAAAVLRDYVRQVPEDLDMRLTLAGVVLNATREPRQALKHLAKIPESELDGPLLEKRRRIQQQARRLAAESKREPRTGGRKR